MMGDTAPVILFIWRIAMQLLLMMVLADLAVWQKLNVTAFLATGMAGATNMPRHV